MKKILITLPDEVAHSLSHAARRHGLSRCALVGGLCAAYVERPAPVQTVEDVSALLLNIRTLFSMERSCIFIVLNYVLLYLFLVLYVYNISFLGLFDFGVPLG